ncbi:hypothetical protein [uncultured Tolumonas sp.]|uniref:hypothetical protein n=1 Tax=uncultured Tolumonas sp. TaxID=263765 RepID=UPI00292F55DF|nr:hypothetical protein [uncultured Tolumonas sp.]
MEINEAKARSCSVLMNDQSESFENLKKENSIPVVMSYQESQLTEEQKMALVKARFSDIDDNDLVDGDTFFKDLDSGMYD